jgi:hypothetical protein
MEEAMTDLNLNYFNAAVAALRLLSLEKRIEALARSVMLDREEIGAHSEAAARAADYPKLISMRHEGNQPEPASVDEVRRLVEDVPDDDMPF